MTASELGACVAERWSPGIGDPEVTGWVTVLAYVVCAVLSALVWRRLSGQRGRVFWGLLVVLLGALAINKQLDLQSAMTAVGRCLAQVQGWYDDRYTVQVAFIAALAVGALAMLLAIALSLRGQVARHLGAVLGITLVSGFVVTRAASFHHMDRLISDDPLGLPNNFLFENAGLVLIGLNAVLLLTRRTPG